MSEYTPQTNDTLWKVRYRILAYLQTLPGADAADAPQPNDTRKTQIDKILRALQ